jgi:hypothetical protein
MYNILVKYPTRSRPDLFLKTLSEYYKKASNNQNITYLISYDLDDESMTDEVIEKALSLGNNVICIPDHSKSKIHACNRDIEFITDPWDICLLISDDMFIQAEGWDEIIRNNFIENFADTDGCLWYHDGYQKVICTLSCVGRKYYDRFGYLYHPSYYSFFCDNEFTDIALREKKMIFIDQIIISHQHPNWGKGVPVDSLYTTNNKYWDADKQNYSKRLSKNFL